LQKMDALLTDLYYDQHLTSIQALYPEAVQAAPPGLKITKVAVANWLKNQGAQQQVKRQTHDDHPITTDNQGLWQLDLTFLDQMARVTVAQPQPVPVQGAVRNRGQRVAVAAPVTTEGLPENIPVTDDIVSMLDEVVVVGYPTDKWTITKWVAVFTQVTNDTSAEHYVSTCMGPTL
jgi:hypothetical protein